MGAPKRKRQSMDSAIADMSGEDSFSTGSETHASDSNTSITQQEDSAGSRQSKRRKSSYTTVPFSFSVRDYGTAASQRPRRGAASQEPPPFAIPQTSTRKGNRTRTTTTDQANGKHTTGTSLTPKDEIFTPLPAHEVNGNIVEREQTPSQNQAPVGLPTPPQTGEKTNTQAAPQPSLRRSARERRPTERSQQASTEQVTPSRKKSIASTNCVIDNRGEDTPTTKNRKSCIVRLRVPSSCAHHKPGQSMSFTGSFSHRQKSSDNHGSHASQEQRKSFVENGSFLDYDRETFAQPQEEPILADSQELYSSQIGPDDETTDSHAAAHLQQHLQVSGSSTRERFSTSGWISRQDQQRSFAAFTPETSPQRQNRSNADAPTMQIDAATNNGSWQTQPTLPWCPSWNAPSPGGTQQAPTSANISFYASQATTIDEESMHLPPFNQKPSLNKEELHDIADELFAHRTFGPPKPEPVGQPPVWADARMDLCETLHYFRSYQSACHSTGGFVRGFMFDKVAHPRDYIDSNVVIARAGGGQVRDKDSGEMKASRDQVEGITSQNLRNCMSHYNPVVIITGIDNPHIPSQPPHQYCVLDYFKPTHIWAEKSGNSKIVRYRFEKLNARKDSWWRPESIEDPVELGSLPPPFIKSCGTCARESLQIYLNGWMCLQPTCGSFWLIFPSGPDSSQGTEPFEPDEASLVYDPRFLKAHTLWPNDDHEYPLTSNEAILSSHAVPGEDTSETFIRGVVCPLCGRCNSRIDWRGWECPCGWKKTPPHTLIPAITLREPLWPLTYSYTPSRDTQSPLVTAHISFAYNYRINRYTLPGISGFITHMIANRTVIEELGGPDAMFEELQQVDIGLRRRPLENSQLKGEMYTRNFLVNYGMPYKFIAATDSHPFSSAARPITATRSRLNWAARYLLSHEPSHASPSSSVMSTCTTSNSSHTSETLREFEQHEFNEVLALGYFEAQKISYHDDGEHGLGPTIATLSLGAPGTMRIRLKAKHHLGLSNAGVYTDALPLPGCNSYEARMGRVDELRDAKAMLSPAAYRKRLKELPKEMKLKGSGNAKDALTLKLGHGDIVVMHGAEMQKYYEHSVDHGGKLRFALTCRYIDPDSLREHEKPEYEVERDNGGYDGAAVVEGGGGERGEAMDHTLT